MKRILISVLIVVTFLLTGYSLVKQDSSNLDPMLVIMYDDGAVEDYEVAFPVHQKHGVPGVVCANSSTLDTPDNLSVEQVKELESAGWEIVNHGKYHAALDDREVSKAVRRGDIKIYLKLPYRVKDQYQYLLFNKNTGKQEVVNVVNVYVDDNNRKSGFVRLENGTKNSYPAAGTYLRLTRECAMEEVVIGKNELLALGLNVTNYTYSYNAYEDWSEKLVAEYHNVSRSNTGGKWLFNRTNTFPLNRYALYATNFETDKTSDSKLRLLLEQTAREGGVTILWAHTWSERFTQERLDYIMQLAKKNRIEIVTLEEAINNLES